MSKQVSQTRAALLGLLFALVGFSYAVATSVSTQAVSNDVGSRAVGSATLRFTNPNIGTVASPIRDLGLAATGSSVTRYARATGGVAPYKFTSSTTPSLASAIASSTSTLTLLVNGCLSGSLGNLPAGALNFTITVTDSKGTQPGTVTENFRLTLDNSGVFKLATATLVEGVQYQAYYDKLEVLNGNGPFTFAASSVKLDGTAKTNLEAVGLSLSSTDGTIFGKPLVSGVLTFTATVTDSKSKTATGTVTITLTASSLITGSVVFDAISASVGQAGKDQIKLAASVNLNGRKISDLTGDTLEVRLGQFSTSEFTASKTPATLDSKGKINKPAKGAAAKTDPTFKGGVSSKGLLKVAIAKLTLTGKLGTLTGATVNLGVGVKIGDSLASSGFVQFDVKSSSSKTTLSYKRNGADTLTGEFLVTDVKGKDSTGATAGGSWKVSFIALPAADVDFNAPTSASVAIGTTFTDTLVVTEKNGKVSGKNAKADNKVLSLKMDAIKGKGSLSTSNLDSSKTNIKEAGSASATGNTFALGVTLSKSTGATFQGEGGLAIFPNNTSWGSVQK
jgi:hypothetical protein